MGINYRKARADELALLYNSFIQKYFPPMEVKPLRRIKEMVEDGMYTVVAMCDDDKYIGAAFISTSKEKTAYLLDYLCVDDKYRSNGYGGMLLSEVAKNYSDNKVLIIETETIESADNENDRLMRSRRNEFYQRNGAKKADLVTNIFEVEYDIWVMNYISIDLAEELRKIYHYMVDEKLYSQYVFI